MTLLNTIKEKAATFPNDEILKKMGYHNKEAGKQRLDSLLKSYNLYDWLKAGGFDMKYSSEAFLKKLIEVLGIENADADKEIEEYRGRMDAISKMAHPYIYIDTHFRRQSQPIFVLAFMEGKRRIKIDKEELYGKSLEEVLESISLIIRNHYEESGGSLPVWGKIYTYAYHHTDGSSYIFDTDGKVQDDTEEICESKAELITAPGN